MDPRSQLTLLRHQNKPVPGGQKTYGIFGLFLILFVLLKKSKLLHEDELWKRPKFISGFVMHPALAGGLSSQETLKKTS